MKAILKITSILILFSVLTLTSCRKEEIQSIQAPIDETLDGNSNVANLIKRTTTNDGSNDNIIDYANCFNIQLPVIVSANGFQLTINTEDDYDNIEAVFDEFDDDTDYLDISFPITIILTDYSTVIINNINELYSYSNNCNGENEFDDDIECIDFLFPISASVFNTNNELIDVVTFMDDNQLYDFIEDIDINDIITIDFPITVILSDSTEIIINNLTELETTIENAENDCDEDDDFDYNDDDCDGCTSNQVIDYLTNCSDWIVDKLENDGNNFDDLYNGYLFNFFNDGTVSVFWSSTTVYGTWSASGSENNITVVINIPSLPYCNNDWVLHEIQDAVGETKLDLRFGDSDRIRYESTCN